MKRHWLWRLYFGGMLVLPFAVPADDPSRILSDIALLSLYIVQLVALYAFVFSKRLGTPRLWQIIFVVTVLEFGWMTYEFLVVDSPPADLGPMFLASIAIGTTVLLLPLGIAIYIYAFRSAALWQRAT